MNFEYGYSPDPSYPSFSYKHPPVIGAGVIDNLFRSEELLPTSRREKFNIPLPSRPELAALHVVNPRHVDPSFHAADRREGHLILRRPTVGASDKSPEIQGTYKQSDAERGALALEFLLKPVENMHLYQVHINIQLPQSNEKLSPGEASDVCNFLYGLINFAATAAQLKAERTKAGLL